MKTRHWESAPAAPIRFTVLTLSFGTSPHTAKASDFRTIAVVAGSELEARDLVAPSVAPGHYMLEINPQGAESAALLRARARATEERPPADMRSSDSGNRPRFISHLTPE